MSHLSNFECRVGARLRNDFNPCTGVTMSLLANFERSAARTAILRFQAELYGVERKLHCAEIQYRRAPRHPKLKTNYLRLKHTRESLIEAIASLAHRLLRDDHGTQR